jgi:hypothetical protein
VLVLGLGLIVWHAYTEAYHQYQAVSTVVPNLTSARQELSQGLLPENDPIGDALATATQVQSEVDHPSWMVRITASLPVLKQPILAVRAGVKAALEESLGAHDLQSIATDVLGESLSTQGTGQSVDQSSTPIYSNGQVNIDLLESLVPRIQSALTHLQAADRSLRAIPNLPFVSGLPQLKANALADSHDAIAQVQQALAGAKVLPGFFGADGKRTYFLAMANNAETRANGGAVLAYAFVTMDHGKLEFGSAGGLVGSPFDKRKVGFPGVKIPDSVRWYLDHAPGAPLHIRIPDTSLTPDFPAVAESWRNILASLGHKVDGVIQIDPYAVADVLGDERIRVADYPQAITAGTLPRVVQFDQYFLPNAEQRKLPGELIGRAWQLLQSPSRFLPLVQTLADQVRGKHLQLWSSDPQEQALVQQLGWSGQVAVTPGDYAFPIENVVFGRKVGYFAHTAITYDATVRSSGDIDVTCTVKISNEAPTGLPGYMATTDEYGYATDHTLVGVYIPPNAKVTSSPSDVPPNHTDSGALVLSHQVITTSGRSQSVTWKWVIPNGVQHDATGSFYQFTMQHQALPNTASLVVHVTFPAGTSPLAPDLWVLKGQTATLTTTLTADQHWRIDF